ncbi:MAG: zinc protease [Actinomycetota bacterium]|nr:zinc protease [Actinomycetota bacterium]
MITTDLPTIHLTEVEGIRTVWSELPGPLRCGLGLRVGSSDETLPTCGITHMMEHLAFFGIGRPGDHSNGYVDQTVTMFHCEGDAPFATGFLDSVTRQLVNPPLHRLDDEREILRAEYAGKGYSPQRRLLIWRYGAAGYGLSGFDGMGLHGLTPDLLTTWSRRYATRQNAVLWFSGPPPAGMRINLPDGVSVPPIDPLPGIVPKFPAYIGGPSDVVAVQALLPRNAAAQALGSVMEARLVDELRTRRAAAYSPQVDVSALTGETSELIVLSDLVAGRQSDAVRPLLATLHHLAGEEEQETTADEVDTWRADALRQASDPATALSWPVSQALRVLHGGDVTHPGEWAEQITAVTPDDVTQAAVAALSTALAQVPTRVRVSRSSWVRAPGTLLEPVEGTTYDRRDPEETSNRLIMGEDGISWVGEDTTHTTVTRSSAAGVLVWPDGKRVVVGADANTVEVEPNLWKHGRQIVDQIDHLWSGPLVIPMPPRNPGEIPAPPAPVAGGEDDGPGATGPTGEERIPGGRGRAASTISRWVNGLCLAVSFGIGTQCLSQGWRHQDLRFAFVGLIFCSLSSWCWKRFRS